jgi:hypothetical protein
MPTEQRLDGVGHNSNPLMRGLDDAAQVREKTRLIDNGRHLRIGRFWPLGRRVGIFLHG